MKEKAQDFAMSRSKGAMERHRNFLCLTKKKAQERKRQRKAKEEAKGVEIAVPAKEERVVMKMFHILT